MQSNFFPIAFHMQSFLAVNSIGIGTLSILFTTRSPEPAQCDTEEALKKSMMNEQTLEDSTAVFFTWEARMEERRKKE